jgi:hypothetical protein
LYAAYVKACLFLASAAYSFCPNRKNHYYEDHY